MRTFIISRDAALIENGYAAQHLQKTAVCCASLQMPDNLHVLVYYFFCKNAFTNSARNSSIEEIHIMREPRKMRLLVSRLRAAAVPVATCLASNRSVIFSKPQLTDPGMGAGDDLYLISILVFKPACSECLHGIESTVRRVLPPPFRASDDSFILFP